MRITPFTPWPHASLRALVVSFAVAAPIAAVAAPVSSDIRPLALASHETEPSFDDDAGGRANADDPAIWVHPKDPARSLVIATLKEGGLAVYALNGRTVQRIAAPAAPQAGDAPGRFNNVDVIEGFRLGGQAVDLAVVTDRGRDTLRIYRIHPGAGAPLADITDAHAPWVFSRNRQEVNRQATAYGLATLATRHGGAIAAVSQRERARLAVVELFDTGRGTVSYRQRQSIDVPARFQLPGGASWTPCQDEDGVQPQVEGMVFDRRSGALYAAQEQVGIWRVALNDVTPLRLIDTVRTFGVPYERTWDADEEEYTCRYSTAADASAQAGRHLSADAEGLTILYGDPGDDGADSGRGPAPRARLFASSQGDSRFVVYDLDRDHAVLGSLRIGDGPVVDGAQHSDGAAVTGRPLGPLFPRGLLVMHDGENTPVAVDAGGEARENTNFKFVPLQRVLR